MIKIDGRPYVTRIDLLFSEKDHFAAILNEDGASPGMVTSTDGRTWTARQDFLPDWKVMRHDAHLRRIAQGKGLLVAVGDYGARLVRAKSESKTWEAVAEAKARDTLIDVAFGNGVFVGGGLHGLRMRSEDGLTWTDRVTGEEGEHINAMIFDGQKFVGIGQGGTYQSRDGKVWERFPNHNAPTVAVLGGGIYLGALWPGHVLISTDAINWNPSHQFAQHVLSLNFGHLGNES